VTNVLSTTSKFAENKDKLDLVVKLITKGVDDIIKVVGKLAADDTNAAEVKKSSKEFSEAYGEIRSAVVKVSTLTPQLNLKASKAAMQYVQLSMKAYK
jgi:hypothetical protein